MNAPQGKRPLGISMLSILLLIAAVALLARTVFLHAGWMTGVGRLLAVLIFAVLAIGLWRLRNGARIFLFFLIALDALTSLVALLVYALPQSQHRLAAELMVQFCIAALLIWYLQRPAVRRAFGGLSAWPKTVQMLVLTIFTALLAFPFYWMGIATFKQNIDLYATDNNPFIFNLPPTLNHLRYLFGETQFVRWLGNTALVGVIVVAITLLLAVPAAYSLARLTGRWGERLSIGIFLTYLVPSTLLFIPFSRLVALLGLQNQLWALVLIYPTFTVPFCTWLLMGFFKTLPKEVEESAMVDGCSRLGAIWRIVLPLAVPGLLTIVIFALTLTIQEFVYSLTFISSVERMTVSVGVPVALVRGDVYYWGSLMAACLITSVPLAIVYNFFLDRFIAGFTIGAIK